MSFILPRLFKHVHLILIVNDIGSWLNPFSCQVSYGENRKTKYAASWKTYFTINHSKLISDILEIHTYSQKYIVRCDYAILPIRWPLSLCQNRKSVDFHMRKFWTVLVLYDPASHCIVHFLYISYLHKALKLYLVKLKRTVIYFPRQSCIYYLFMDDCSESLILNFNEVSAHSNARVYFKFEMINWMTDFGV